MMVIIDAKNQECRFSKEERETLLEKITYENYYPRHSSHKNGRVYSYTFSQVREKVKNIPHGFLSVWEYTREAHGWATGANYEFIGLVKFDETEVNTPTLSEKEVWLKNKFFECPSLFRECAENSHIPAERLEVLVSRWNNTKELITWKKSTAKPDASN